MPFLCRGQIKFFRCCLGVISGASRSFGVWRNALWWKVCKGQRLLNISGAKVRETEFRYLGKYLSSRKIDFVCAVGTVCIIKQVFSQVRSAKYALSVTIIEENVLSGFFRFEKPHLKWVRDWYKFFFLDQRKPLFSVGRMVYMTCYQFQKTQAFVFRKITSSNN